MTLDMMNRVWWRTDLNTMEKFVALALADHANEDYKAFPSVDRIALKCSCVRRTVQNALRGLEAKGLLRCVRRKDRTSYYQFPIDLWPQIDPPKSTPKERKFTRVQFEALMAVSEDEPGLFDDEMTGAFNSSEVLDTEFEGVHDVPGRVHLTTATDAADAPKTKEEPSEETKEESGVEKSTALVVASDPTNLSDLIQVEWAKLKAEHPFIAGLRRVPPASLKLAYERAQQHASGEETSMDVWRVVFAEIRKSRFLTGNVPPGPGRTSRFKLTLTHLLKSHIFAKAVNGGYSSDDIDGSFDPHSGRKLGPAEQAARSTSQRFRSARERGRG